MAIINFKLYSWNLNLTKISKKCASHFRRETANINKQFKHWYLSHAWADKAFMGTIVRRALSHLHWGSLKITLQTLYLQENQFSGQSPRISLRTCLCGNPNLKIRVLSILKKVNNPFKVAKVEIYLKRLHVQEKQRSAIVVTWWINISTKSFLFTSKNCEKERDQ